MQSLSKDFLVCLGDKTSTGEPENEVCAKMNVAEIILESQRKKRHEWGRAAGMLLHTEGSAVSHVKDFVTGGRARGPVSIRSVVVSPSTSTGLAPCGHVIP